MGLHDFMGKRWLFYDALNSVQRTEFITDEFKNS
jgi:hypothetical protein